VLFPGAETAVVFVYRVFVYRKFVYRVFVYRVFAKLRNQRFGI